MGQELPATLEERIQAFQKQLKRVKEVGVIGNMDETPLFLMLRPGRSSILKERKTSLFEQLAVKRAILTVTLTVFCDGTVLPAQVIFKGKRQPDFDFREDEVYH